MLNIHFYSPSLKWARVVSFVSRTCPNSWCRTRGLHQRRALLYELEDGLGEFLPPPALKTVAVDWQQGLLERLNEEVKDTEDEGMSLAKTVINTAAREDRTLAFNYASLALNNGFFLDHLKPPPSTPALDHSEQISSTLANAIRHDYGSLAQLKSDFSAAALGMFTSGWVWFVCDKNGHTGIFPTFGPGTLLIRSRTYLAQAKGPSLGDAIPNGVQAEHVLQYESGEQLNLSKLGQPPPSPPGVSPSSPKSAGSRNPPVSNPLLPRFYSTTLGEVEARSIYDHNDVHEPETKVDLLNAGEVLFPLFCISVHEHAWMASGYGVWGKEEWLKKFWTVLDWEKVSSGHTSIMATHK
ncbi:hypothetical protein APHAL10511_002025 [Amanita phalloides]|nr:hypothetical protein APHAL10511_002025 [Amanita phalloides]